MRVKTETITQDVTAEDEQVTIVIGAKVNRIKVDGKLLTLSEAKQLDKITIDGGKSAEYLDSLKLIGRVNLQYSSKDLADYPFLVVIDNELKLIQFNFDYYSFQRWENSQQTLEFFLEMPDVINNTHCPVEDLQIVYNKAIEEPYNYKSYKTADNWMTEITSVRPLEKLTDIWRNGYPDNERLADWRREDSARYSCEKRVNKAYRSVFNWLLLAAQFCDRDTSKITPYTVWEFCCYAATKDKDELANFLCVLHLQERWEQEAKLFILGGR